MTKHYNKTRDFKIVTLTLPQKENVALFGGSAYLAYGLDLVAKN